MKKQLFNNIFMKKKNEHQQTLISVCAWCPKEEYPKLKSNEEYTHGMCRKHYRKLSIRKNISISFRIAEFFDTTSIFVSNQSKKYLKRLKSSLKSPDRNLEDRTDIVDQRKN